MTRPAHRVTEGRRAAPPAFLPACPKCGRKDEVYFLGVTRGRDAFQCLKCERYFDGAAGTRQQARARYQVLNLETCLQGRLVIRDVGPWSEYPTVTNDAEAVVAELVARQYLPAGRRLFYFDSDGVLDELLVADGRFAGFAPAGPALRAEQEAEQEAEHDCQDYAERCEQDGPGGKSWECLRCGRVWIQ